MKRFLNLLKQYFLYLRFRSDRPPAQIKNKENISRFIFDPDHFNRNTGNIKTAVFHPHPKNKTFSVYRTINCDERKIWWLGDRFVGNLPLWGKRKVLARADLDAQEYLNLDLKIKPLRIPHPRHADIAGWPSEKLKIKSIAQSLKKLVSLRVKP